MERGMRVVMNELVCQALIVNKLRLSCDDVCSVHPKSRRAPRCRGYHTTGMRHVCCFPTSAAPTRCPRCLGPRPRCLRARRIDELGAVAGIVVKGHLRACLPAACAPWGTAQRRSVGPFRSPLRPVSQRRRRYTRARGSAPSLFNNPMHPYGDRSDRGTTAAQVRAIWLLNGSQELECERTFLRTVV